MMEELKKLKDEISGKQEGAPAAVVKSAKEEIDDILASLNLEDNSRKK